MVAFGCVAFLWISRIFSAYYFVEKFDFDLRRNEFLIFLVGKKKQTMKPKPEKSKEKQKNQSQPWENPVKIQRKPKKTSFAMKCNTQPLICDEMQQGKSAIHFFTNLSFFGFFWIFSVFFQWLALVFLVFFGFPSGF